MTKVTITLKLFFWPNHLFGLITFGIMAFGIEAGLQLGKWVTGLGVSYGERRLPRDTLFILNTLLLETKFRYSRVTLFDVYMHNIIIHVKQEILKDNLEYPAVE